MSSDTYPLGPILADARSLGWRIRVVDLHTVTVTHPTAGERIVNGKPNGWFGRKALLQEVEAMRQPFGVDVWADAFAEQPYPPEYAALQEVPVP